MEKIDINTMFGFWPKRPIDASAAALLARMQDSGIDKAFTCSFHGMLYDFTEGNDLTLQTCRNSDGRLLPVATINPQTYFGVLDEVDRIVQNGFRIIRFFPSEQEWSVSQRHFTRLLDKIAGAPLAVMLPSTEGITNIAAVTRHLPNPVIIETLRAYVHLADLLVNAAEHPHLYIETHSVGSDAFIEVLTRELTPDRLLFGSGAPLHCFASAVLPINHADIPEPAKEMIFSRNIKRILTL